MLRELIVGMGVAAAAATPADAGPKSFSVRSAAVAHDGEWHADPNGRQTREQCRRFRLSSAAALNWFRSANEVSKHDWLETLDWTQCTASGTLTTQDRKTYRWELDQSGRARIVVSPTVSVYLGGRSLPFAP